MKFPTIEFDAVIVGAGGAGMRASLQMAQSGMKVAVLSKVFPTRSHTVAAQGGIAASLGNVEEDHWQWHMYDTVAGSDYLGDQDAIEYMCQHAPRAVYELEHMGMPFSRLDSGKIYQRYFGGHTQDFGKKSTYRACAVADRTGHAMLHTLYQKNNEANTTFYNEWLAIDLVKASDGKSISGVIALCLETGEYAFFKARAVILATGGAGRIYKSTTNAFINTGDGIGMVLRAGFPVQDMEFWQFHPTGLYGAGVLLTEGCRGEGGYLVNKDGERFMERYSPVLKDLACRDVVSRASIMEILAGRGCGPKGDHVLLKLDHLGEEVLKSKLPGITEISKTFANVDPAKEPVPVVPTCHYMMGGIPTNIHGQVVTVDKQGKEQVVDGLYAAGECACVSVHGANRLGTNSLLDIVVFGRAAGMHLETAITEGLSYRAPDEAEFDRVQQRIDRWEQPANTENMVDIRNEIQDVMQSDFGVFRDEKPMATGLQHLEDLESKLQRAQLKDRSKTFNTARMEAFELDNLMAVAKATAALANNRTESRGAHSRNDYTDRDDANWLKHSVYFADGSISYRSVNFKPAEVKPFEPKERD